MLDGIGHQGVGDPLRRHPAALPRTQVDQGVERARTLDHNLAPTQRELGVARHHQHVGREGLRGALRGRTKPYDLAAVGQGEDSQPSRAVVHEQPRVVEDAVRDHPLGYCDAVDDPRRGQIDHPEPVGVGHAGAAAVAGPVDGLLGREAAEEGDGVDAGERGRGAHQGLNSRGGRQPYRPSWYRVLPRRRGA